MTVNISEPNDKIFGRSTFQGSFINLIFTLMFYGHKIVQIFCGKHSDFQLKFLKTR